MAQNTVHSPSPFYVYQLIIVRGDSQQMGSRPSLTLQGKTILLLFDRKGQFAGRLHASNSPSSPTSPVQDLTLIPWTSSKAWLAFQCLLGDVLPRIVRRIHDVTDFDSGQWGRPVGKMLLGNRSNN